MRMLLIPALCLGLAPVCAAQNCEARSAQLLCVAGEPWLETSTTPFIRADTQCQEATCRVFTHIWRLDQTGPLTKGPGGMYSNHRGIFLGWADTIVAGNDYDSWAMSNCYQQHKNWEHIEMGPERARQVEHIQWRNFQDKPFIEETRSFAIAPGPGGSRIIDFTAHLRTTADRIELAGGPHFGGVHVRLSDEVTAHPETTRFILPAGASMLDDGTAPGAWWVCAAAEVRGRRFWLMHMTSPETTAGAPLYSARRYGRVGAYFETAFTNARPLILRCRFVLSPEALDRAACAGLYAELVEGAS